MPRQRVAAGVNPWLASRSSCAVVYGASSPSSMARAQYTRLRFAVPTGTFDTLKASHDLKAAGFDTLKAAAVVRTVGEAFADTVATKADIAAVKAELKADVTTVKAELRADIASVRTEIQTVKAEIFRALWIQGVGIVGLIVGLTKLLD